MDESYFGYILKDGMDINYAILKIKEEIIKTYKQELEKNVASLIMDFVNRKQAGYDNDRINFPIEDVNFSEVPYTFKDKLIDIFNKMEILKKSTTNSCLLKVYELDNKKILLELDLPYFDCVNYGGTMDIVLISSMEKLNFINKHTNIKKFIDYSLFFGKSKQELNRYLLECCIDWRNAYSLNKDKIKEIKLLDSENLTDINSHNVEKIIEDNFESRLKEIAKFKLYDNLNLDKMVKKDCYKYSLFLESENYHKSLEIQMKKERQNLKKTINLNFNSTLNQLLNQC